MAPLYPCAPRTNRGTRDVRHAETVSPSVHRQLGVSPLPTADSTMAPHRLQRGSNDPSSNPSPREVGVLMCGVGVFKRLERVGPDMAEYLPRLIDPVIEQLLAELPALSIVGPRASGKTTTAARHSSDVVRLDRDDEARAEWRLPRARHETDWYQSAAMDRGICQPERGPRRTRDRPTRCRQPPPISRSVRVAYRRSGRSDVDCPRSPASIAKPQPATTTSCNASCSSINRCVDHEPAQASDSYTETISCRCLVAEWSLWPDSWRRAPRRKAARPLHRNIRHVATPRRAGCITFTTAALPLPATGRTQRDRRDRCACARGDRGQSRRRTDGERCSSSRLASRRTR